MSFVLCHRGTISAELRERKCGRTYSKKARSSTLRRFYFVRPQETLEGEPRLVGHPLVASGPALPPLTVGPSLVRWRQLRVHEETEASQNSALPHRQLPL